MRVFRSAGSLWVTAVVLGCSGTTVTNNYVKLTGGTSGTGGTTQMPTGGQVSTGGAAAGSGGTVHVGGASESSTSSGGGPSSSGGSGVAVGGNASGGTADTTTAAGGTGSGGIQSGGSTSATGGSSANSTQATGGTTFGSGGAVTGGTHGTGGATATGGASPTGGTTSATGGVSPTGGTPSATGGASPTGGTTSAVGGTATGGALQTGGTTAGGNAGLLSSCELLLHMDETAWNGTTGEVHDSSGANNNGTAMGSVTTASSRAKYGRAGLFDGSGYVSVADSSSLHAGNAFTVSAWIYPTGLNGSAAPGIVAKRIAYGSGCEFAVFVWTNNAVYVDVDGETERFASNAILANGAWYNIVVVFDGNQPASQRVSLYINGQLDSVHAESSSTVTMSAATVNVGDLPGGGDKFIGSIDEVAFWQRALSASEVTGIYQGNSAL